MDTYLTRMSGGESCGIVIKKGRLHFYPHERGVYLNFLNTKKLPSNVTRISGGVSTGSDKTRDILICYPHQRGCIHLSNEQIVEVIILPASAGVNLLYLTKTYRKPNLTRMSGGESKTFGGIYIWIKSYPHQRGCFQ